MPITLTSPPGTAFLFPWGTLSEANRRSFRATNLNWRDVAYAMTDQLALGIRTHSGAVLGRSLTHPSYLFVALPSVTGYTLKVHTDLLQHFKDGEIRQWSEFPGNRSTVRSSESTTTRRTITHVPQMIRPSLTVPQRQFVTARIQELRDLNSIAR